MKRATILSLSASFLFLCVTWQPAWAGRFPGSGLAGSAHDFTRTSRIFSDAGEPTRACFFCHFQDSRLVQDAPGVLSGNPAGAGSFSRYGRESSTAPLWNPALAATVRVYAMYQNGSGAPTRGKNASQAIANGMAPGSTSLLCLSCHDGNIAANAYTNALDISADSGRISGGMGLIGSGGSLANHHPIGFDYDAVQAADKEIRMADVAVLGRAGTVRDHLSGEGATRMECSTCHSVHNSGNTGENLLWRSDRSSRLCLTCHDKGWDPGAITP